jgi:hypothetical protein
LARQFGRLAQFTLSDFLPRSSPPYAFDKDGDAWWLSYNNKGEDRSWTVVAGTGKYAGMTGSGATKLLAITPDGRMTISWSGAMKMK